MIGYAMRDSELVEMALRGTKRDGDGGFLRQLDLLFSPDGYYMEGPYYLRYALMPFYLFAEAVERHQPELGIYERRGRILKKALYSALRTAYPNGAFPPINDASRSMGITAPEIVLALNLAWIQKPEWFGLPHGPNLTPDEQSLPVRLSFLSVSLSSRTRDFFSWLNSRFVIIGIVVERLSS